MAVAPNRHKDDTANTQERRNADFKIMSKSPRTGLYPIQTQAANQRCKPQ
jgi:hypothetical protein